LRRGVEIEKRLWLAQGSATSESSVQAALFACDEILKRLAKYMRPPGKPSVPWGAAVMAAGAAGTPLTAYGYYDGDKSANLQPAPPNPPAGFTYFVYAAACAQCEVDVLTGEITVLSIDVVYDTGQSLNPKIDLGQIEGGLIMALGWYLTEQIAIDPVSGILLSNGTWDYKPPQSKDIPVHMGVHTLEDTPNTAGIMGSKFVGEPPMVCANCILFAAKNAVAAARKQAGDTTWFQLDIPATPERLQQACVPAGVPACTCARMLGHSRACRGEQPPRTGP
jgi:xanthine dehydrogenase/oxidase